MWYKSNITDRIVHRGSTEYVLNNMYGRRYFDEAVANGELTKIPDPTVEQLLTETKSINLAATRYMEIQHCSIAEAREQVVAIADELGIDLGKKGAKVRTCQKNVAAKTANTESRPVTSK